MKYIKLFESDNDDWVGKILKEHSYFKSPEDVKDYFQDYIDDGFKFSIKRREITDGDTTTIEDKHIFNLGTQKYIQTSVILSSPITDKTFILSDNDDLNAKNISALNNYKNLLDSLPRIKEKVAFDFTSYLVVLQTTSSNITLTIEIFEKIPISVYLDDPKSMSYTTLMGMKARVESLGYVVDLVDKVLVIWAPDEELKKTIRTYRVKYQDYVFDDDSRALLVTNILDINLNDIDLDDQF